MSKFVFIWQSLRIPRITYDLRVYLQSLPDVILSRKDICSRLPIDPKLIKQGIQALHVIGDIVEVRWRSYDEISKTITKNVFVVLKPAILIELLRSVIAIVGPHVLQVGILSRSKITLHWSRILPPLYHEVIVRLLDEMGIMAPLDAERYLVPSLLPDCKPDLDLMALKEPSIVLRRSFLLKPGVTLPLGAISHMIAATIRWSEGGVVNSIWRSGCVVTRDNILFSVRTDWVFQPPQAGIHLVVSAKQSGKALTFAFLHFQNAIRYLFTSFYDLEFVEIIPSDTAVSDWTTLADVMLAREKASNVVTWKKSNGKVWVSQICPDILLEDMMTRIPKDQIQFLESLKTFDGGRVLKASVSKGVVRRNRSDTEAEKAESDRVVAVVRLYDENFTSENVVTANREAFLMVSLQSPYILSLYGVCTDYQTLLVIMEYMEYGNLEAFLDDPVSVACKLSAFMSSFDQSRLKYSSQRMSDVLENEVASLRCAVEECRVGEVEDAMEILLDEAAKAWGSQDRIPQFLAAKQRVLFFFFFFFFFLLLLVFFLHFFFKFFTLLSVSCCVPIVFPSYFADELHSPPPISVGCTVFCSNSSIFFLIEIRSDCRWISVSAHILSTCGTLRIEGFQYIFSAQNLGGHLRRRNCVQYIFENWRFSSIRIHLQQQSECRKQRASRVRHAFSPLRT